MSDVSFDIDNGCFICIFVTSIIRCSICPLRNYKQDLQHFYRKGHQYKTLPPPKRIISMSEVKKPTVPTIADKPIIGLKSNKNYITSNPIDNILLFNKKKLI